jgi:hypothetical protein
MGLVACGRDTPLPQDQLYCEIDGVAFQSKRMTVQYSQVGSITDLQIYAYNEKDELLYIKVYAIGNATTTHFVNPQTQHNLAYAPAGNLNQANATYQTRTNCIGETGTYIEISNIQDFFATGAFNGKTCLPNGQFKTIRNGRFEQVRLP